MNTRSERSMNTRMNTTWEAVLGEALIGEVSSKEAGEALPATVTFAAGLD